MGLFEQFPYSNFHSLNLDWIIEQIKNTIDNAVLSVNGQTGEVILYQSENVVFPDVDSDQWRMVRTAAGHTAGVLFNQDYMYVMYDNTADRVYTMNHPQIIFPDAATRLPDVTEDYTNIRRQIETNGTPNIVGIELKQDKAYRMKDAGRYEIYDSDNQPPYPVTSVNGNTGAIVIAIPFLDIDSDDILFSTQASGHEWALGRETQDGTASIQLITDSTKAEAYVDFYDGEGLTYTKKLLTTDDIPSSSGVVSINGQTGVVTIYGNTMPIESGSADSVKDVTDSLGTRLTTAEGTITQQGTDIGTLNTKVGQIKSDIAIVEDTNNATHNITAGQYVVWNGLLYTASSNISIGDGLSASNLAAVPNGGLNDLQNQVTTLNSKISIQYGPTPYTTLNQIKAFLNSVNSSLSDNQWKEVRFNIGGTNINPFGTWSSYCGKLTRFTSTVFICEVLNISGNEIQICRDGDTWNIVSLKETISPSSANSFNTCNDAYNNGMKGISFVMVNAGSSDSPSTTGVWVVLQNNADANSGFQLAMQSDTNDVYFRTKYIGNWRSWAKLTNS